MGIGLGLQDQQRQEEAMERIKQHIQNAYGEVPSPPTATRHNQGKPQLSYVLSARYAVEGVAKVMEFGATKYDRDNWKKGLSAENCIDSLLRHIAKYLDGELVDEESGCPHLDHVATNALFLAHHHNGRKPQ